MRTRLEATSMARVTQRLQSLIPIHCRTDRWPRHRWKAPNRMRTSTRCSTTQTADRDRRVGVGRGTASTHGRECGYWRLCTSAGRVVQGNRLNLDAAKVQAQGIAAASIVAKATRDRLMARLDERYPGYGFARHTGYRTTEHRSAVARLGPSPEHRLSFRPSNLVEAGVAAAPASLRKPARCLLARCPLQRWLPTCSKRRRSPTGPGRTSRACPVGTRAAFIRRALLDETDPVQATESDTATETTSGDARPRRTTRRLQNPLSDRIPPAGSGGRPGSGRLRALVAQQDRP